MFEISKLKELKLPELQEIAQKLSISKFKSLKKLDLVYKILDHQADNPSEESKTTSEVRKPVKARKVVGERKVIGERKPIEPIKSIEDKKAVEDKKVDHKPIAKKPFEKKEDQKN